MIFICRISRTVSWSNWVIWRFYKDITCTACIFIKMADINRLRYYLVLWLRPPGEYIVWDTLFDEDYHCQLWSIQFLPATLSEHDATTLSCSCLAVVTPTSNSLYPQNKTVSLPNPHSSIRLVQIWCRTWGNPAGMNLVCLYISINGGTSTN